MTPRKTIIKAVECLPKTHPRFRALIELTLGHLLLTTHHPNIKNQSCTQVLKIPHTWPHHKSNKAPPNFNSQNFRKLPLSTTECHSLNNSQRSLVITITLDRPMRALRQPLTQGNFPRTIVLCRSWSDSANVKITSSAIVTLS